MLWEERQVVLRWKIEGQYKVKERKGKTGKPEGKIKKRKTKILRSGVGRSEDFHPLSHFQEETGFVCGMTNSRGILCLTQSVPSVQHEERYPSILIWMHWKQHTQGKFLCCSNILWENRKHLWQEMCNTSDKKGLQGSVLQQIQPSFVF